MSNSQEQSLNESATFFSPCPSSSPDFLHSEAERYCVESLVSSGPGAFYSTLQQESAEAFLSPAEVAQISGWSEERSLAGLEDAHGEEEEEEEDFSGHYFPTQSDTPAPSLELGWPERNVWRDVGQVEVYSSPPAEGSPPIREVLRRLLQGANKVIAVVTDKLSDLLVIGDLLCAASRGVPVYLILNRRSVQENCSAQRLQHPNIRVRVLGGKTFLSRDTRMVVGELKANFVLVDLETVMMGSYSLAWTDAHLHRQMVTVMSGPVAESFDREFRILYAASLPIPEAWRSGKPVPEARVLVRPAAKLELKEVVSSPPPPPLDRFLDWEAMGVIRRFPDSCVLSPAACEGLQHRQDRVPEGWRFPVKDGNARGWSGFPDDGLHSSMFLPEFRLPEYRRPRRNFSLGDVHVHSGDFMNRAFPAAEGVSFPVYTPRSHRPEADAPPSHEEVQAAALKAPACGVPAHSDHQLKPQEVTRSKTFSTLSDIMKRINARSSDNLSRSTLELSLPPAEPRTPNCENVSLTPALALMKKRNDEIKSGLLRNMFSSGLRGSSFGLQRETWRSSFRSADNNEQ